MMKNKKAIGLFASAIILAVLAAVFAVYGHMLWVVTLIVSQIVLILAVRKVMTGEQ